MNPTTHPATGTDVATITGNPERIARTLTACHLAASTEPTRTHLTVVQITATPTGTTYRATDGYHAVEILDPKTTGTGTTHLDPASIVAVRDMATAHTKATKKDHSGTMSLTIDNHAETLTATIDHPAHPATLTRPAPHTGVTFPPVAEIMAPRTDDDEPLPVGLSPTLLANVAKITSKLAPRTETPLLLTHAHPRKPARFTAHTPDDIYLAAVVMPQRI